MKKRTIKEIRESSESFFAQVFHNPYKPEYCTQNNGHCITCSLCNYGRDCKNNKIN